MMLRRKGLVPATTLLELCFRLFRCPDKLLRKTLYNYIVNDIKQVNSKHKNARLNSVQTSYFHVILLCVFMCVCKCVLLSILIQLNACLYVL